MSIGDLMHRINMYNLMCKFNIRYIWQFDEDEMNAYGRIMKAQGMKGQLIPSALYKCCDLVEGTEE